MFDVSLLPYFFGLKIWTIEHIKLNLTVVVGSLMQTTLFSSLRDILDIVFLKIVFKRLICKAEGW